MVKKLLNQALRFYSENSQYTRYLFYHTIYLCLPFPLQIFPEAILSEMAVEESADEPVSPGTEATSEPQATSPATEQAPTPEKTTEAAEPATEETNEKE